MKSQCACRAPALRRFAAPGLNATAQGGWGAALVIEHRPELQVLVLARRSSLRRWIPKAPCGLATSGRT